MEQEDDGDTNQSWRPWNNPKESGKETEEMEKIGRIATARTTAQLRLAIILRRVLGSCRYIVIRTTKKNTSYY